MNKVYILYSFFVYIKITSKPNEFMKTPKEEAQELIEKYAIWVWNETVCDWSIAKQYALICVDGIEKALEEYDDRNGTFELQNMDSSFRHYEQVRKEIELL